MQKQKIFYLSQKHLPRETEHISHHRPLALFLVFVMLCQQVGILGNIATASSGVKEKSYIYIQNNPAIDDSWLGTPIKKNTTSPKTESVVYSSASNNADWIVFSKGKQSPKQKETPEFNSAPNIQPTPTPQYTGYLPAVTPNGTPFTQLTGGSSALVNNGIIPSAIMVNGSATIYGTLNFVPANTEAVKLLGQDQSGSVSNVQLGNGISLTGGILSVDLNNIGTGGIQASNISGLVEGQLLFGQSGGSIGQSPQLYWDNVNNSLGIGTGSIGSKFEINSGTGGQSGLRFTQLNNTSTTLSGNGKVLSLNALGEVILTDSSGSFSIGSIGNGLSISGTTLSLGLASTTTTGALSAIDWNTFNNKINLTSLSATGGVIYDNTTGAFGWNGTTDQVTEGLSNLYYTTARFVADFTSRFQTAFDTAFGGKTTDNLIEGTSNLYYTDARVQNTMSGTITSLSGTISLLSSSLAVLDTSINTLSGVVAGNYASLSGAIGTTNNNLASLSGTLATLSTSSQSLSGTLASLSNSINTVSGSLATEILDRINADNNLQDQISSLVTNLNITNAEIATATGNISILSGKVSTIEAQVLSLSGALATLTQTVDTLSGTLAITNANLATLSGVVATKISLSSLSATGGISYNPGTGLFSDIFTVGAGLARNGNEFKIGTLTGGLFSGFTGGQLVFGTASGGLTQSSNLFWDNTNGRLGIGTTSPNTTLTVGTADNLNTVKFTVNGAIQGNANGGGLLLIDGAGNQIFRGLRSPYGTGNSISTYFQLGGTNGIFTGINGSKLTRFGTLTDSFQISNGTNVNTPDPVGLFEVTTATTKLFNILSSGNVGIGTITPNSKLEINSGTGGLSGLRFTQLLSSSASNGQFSGILGVNSTGDVGLAQLTGNSLTGFTTGQLSFGTASGGLTQSNNLFWDNTNGRLGIGTSTPSYALDVNGTANASAFRVWEETTGTGRGVFYGNSGQFKIESINNSPISFAAGGAVRLYVDSTSGNIGIGTNSPLNKFHLLGGRAMIAPIANQRASDIATGSLQINGYTIQDNENLTKDNIIVMHRSGISGITFGSTAMFSLGKYSSQINKSKSALSLSLNENGGNEVSTDMTAMTWQSDGNVGIGTTAPTARLEVNSTQTGASGLKFTQLNSASTGVTSNGKVLSLDASGNVVLANDAGAAGADLIATKTTALTTTVSATPQVVIFGSETIDINSTHNNTTGIYTAPVSDTYTVEGSLQFTIPNANSATPCIAIRRAGINVVQSCNSDFNDTGGGTTGPSSVNISATFTLTAGQTVDLTTFTSLGGGTMPTFITTAGTNYLVIKRVGSAPLVTSDIRLKKNITSFTGGLDDILGLNTVSFEYNGMSKNAVNDGVKHVGIIAQEVQSGSLGKYAISTGPDGYLRYDPNSVLYSLVNSVKAIETKKANSGALAELAQSLSGQLVQLSERINALSFYSGSTTVVNNNYYTQGSSTNTETAETTSSNTSSWVDTAFSFVSSLIVRVEATFSEMVTFMKSVVFRSTVIFEDRVTFADKDMAGTATIRAGSNSVRVDFAYAYTHVPIVTVTADAFVTYRVTDKGITGFTIQTQENVSSDTRFDWIALSTGGATTTISTSGTPATPTETETLETTPTEIQETTIEVSTTSDESSTGSGNTENSEGLETTETTEVSEHTEAIETETPATETPEVQETTPIDVVIPETTETAIPQENQTPTETPQE